MLAKAKMPSLNRCSWVNLNNPLYITYHDEEWGCPVHDDNKHFEMLILEGAQAGLSWETILKKRENYRKLFAGFSPAKVARFTPVKLQKILNNTGIVRNRLKVESAVINARAFLKIQQEFSSFDAYIWAFVNHQPQIQVHATKTPLSDLISRDLKKRGFKFVGTTIIYAYMQAVGLVNDHMSGCFKSPLSGPKWSVYIVRCQNGMLYTGIALDVQKRFMAHQSGKSAKFLRGKGPFTLVFQKIVGTKSAALKLEHYIKSLSKIKKEEIIVNKAFLVAL